ncbi:beta-lactamase family protein, partial [bacterium]|nr:beta-lactamase family protein [bacterium]
LVERAIAEGAFPGAQVAVLLVGRVSTGAFGRLTYEPDSAPVTDATYYDLASVTKMVSTTSLAMSLYDQGALDLAAPAKVFVDEIADDELAGATAAQLLAHSAGYPAWRPLYAALRAEDVGTAMGWAVLLNALTKVRAEYRPGGGAIYSDLDMMMLGVIIERLGDSTLDVMIRERVFGPLGMDEIDFNAAVTRPDAVFAPTEQCGWRGRLLIGEVHDENTFAAGGVTGQSGLFGTARALMTYAGELLAAWRGEGRVFRQDTLRRFATRVDPESNSSFALGFDGRSPQGSLLPVEFGPASFGHWGFTGTGLWIDPERNLAVALLTNRVHPTRDNDRVRSWRAPIMSAAVTDASGGME